MAIHYYAPVEGHEMVPRRDLFPAEPDHPRAGQWYYQLQLARLEHKLPPILVLFTPVFHGVGPHRYSPDFTWPYKGLLVGFDPVAVDATGVRILLAKRRQHFGEDRPLNPPPKHVFLADTRYHLGTADPQYTQLIKLGWDENILI